MSDKVTTPIEFASTRDARHQVQLLRQEGFDFVAGQIEAALPPEYPEGTVAWVTVTNMERDYRWIAFREDGVWRQEVSGDRNLVEEKVTKVEPMRVLADDEVAVKRPRWLDPDTLEISAEDFRKHAELGGWVQQQACLAFADALDAEATS